MKIFIAINIIMGHLKFPRIRMYWVAKTRVPLIADKMSRNQYFKIRRNLRIREYNGVQQIEIDQDKF